MKAIFALGVGLVLLGLMSCSSIGLVKKGDRHIQNNCRQVESLFSFKDKEWVCDQP